MSDSREAFEHWYAGYTGDPYIRHYCDSIGRYQFNSMQSAWAAWQSAHARYARSVEAALKGIVINNNLLGSDVLLRCQPHTTIPVGTVMISCTHPDVAHDCCVVCGVNILPDRPAFEWKGGE